MLFVMAGRQWKSNDGGGIGIGVEFEEECFLLSIPNPFLYEWFSESELLMTSAKG